jgi:hypothetical protein
VDLGSIAEINVQGPGKILGASDKYGATNIELWQLLTVKI